MRAAARRVRRNPPMPAQQMRERAASSPVPSIPLTARQRAAVALWDNLSLSAQRILWDLAPELGAHLDNLGHRRDLERARGAR